MLSSGQAEAYPPRPSETPGWQARLALGIGGVALLVVAFVAWHLRGNVSTRSDDVLPWLVAAAIVLGAAGIIESISSSIWIALIGGFFAVIVAYTVAGRVTVDFDAAAHSVFVIDRFTGDAQLCDPHGCHALNGADASASVSIPLPRLSQNGGDSDAYDDRQQPRPERD